MEEQEWIELMQVKVANMNQFFREAAKAGYVFNINLSKFVHKGDDVVASEMHVRMMRLVGEYNYKND